MDSLIQFATKQLLSENFGFDEGKIYYLLLTDQVGKLNREFSYSKKYRLMKSLFEQGALGKIKSENKDFFTYFMLPPLFIDDNDRIGAYLKEIYLRNKNIFSRNGFFQIILKMNVEKFIEFLKGLDFGSERNLLEMEFNKIRTKEGYEFIGYVSLNF